MPGFLEKKSRVCLCKGRHLLLDKTATSAKGLLSPLISLTPLDSEITIYPQPERIYRGKILHEAIPSWNANGGIHGYCCGEDGFCGPPRLPFLSQGSLRELPCLVRSITLLCCDLWPPGTDIRRGQLSLTFIPIFPFSSHFFLLYPLFTHGKWAQIKSLLKCALLNAIPAVIMPHYVIFLMHRSF